MLNLIHHQNLLYQKVQNLHLQCVRVYKILNIFETIKVVGVKLINPLF